MFVGVVEFDLLLGDVHSLKQKRSVVRPIIAALRKKFAVSVAEVGDHDLHRRAQIAVAVVAPDAKQCGVLMDKCEGLVGQRVEVELLSARQRMFGDND
jgi:ribosome-binding factor A